MLTPGHFYSCQPGAEPQHWLSPGDDECSKGIHGVFNLVLQNVVWKLFSGKGGSLRMLFSPKFALVMRRTLSSTLTLWGEGLAVKHSWNLGKCGNVPENLDRDKSVHIVLSVVVFKICNRVPPIFDIRDVSFPNFLGSVGQYSQISALLLIQGLPTASHCSVFAVWDSTRKPSPHRSGLYLIAEGQNRRQNAIFWPWMEPKTTNSNQNGALDYSF